MPVGQVVAVVNLVAGIAVGYGAWSMHAKNRRRLARWSRKTGVVVAFKKRSGVDDEITAYPVVEYTTEGGTKANFESKTGSSNWGFGVGATIELMVNPDDPQDAEILGQGVQNFVPYALAAISAMMILSAPIALLLF